jgi:PAS domain S-box-containing protein
MSELTLRELTEKVNLQEKQIKESDRTFKAIFCINPIPMCLATIPDGTLVLCNDAFLEATGWEEKEAIGKTMLSLGIYDKPEDRELLLKEAKEKGFVKNLHLIFRDRFGKRFYSVFSAKMLTIHEQAHFLAISIVDFERRVHDRA